MVWLRLEKEREEDVMPPKKALFLTKPYSGYLHSEVPDDDAELTRVGPGTPMGEYLAASGSRSC